MNIGRCELCKCKISFEDSQDGMVVDCPRCKNKTTLTVIEKTPEKAPAPAPPPEKAVVPAPPQETGGEIVIPAPAASTLRLATKPAPAPGKSRPTENDLTCVILQVCSICLLIIGVGLTLNGCISGLRDTVEKDGGGAVRQTVYTLQEGFGLIIVGLSLIVNAMVKILRHLTNKQPY